MHPTLTEEHRLFEKQAWLAACGSGKNNAYYDYAIDGYQAAAELDRTLVGCGFSFDSISPRKANEAIYLSMLEDRCHLAVVVSPLMCFGENTCVVIVEFPDGKHWVECVEDVAEALIGFPPGNKPAKPKWDVLAQTVSDMVEEAVKYNYVKWPGGTMEEAAEDEAEEAPEPISENPVVAGLQKTKEALLRPKKKEDGALDKAIDRFLDKVLD